MIDRKKIVKRLNKGSRLKELPLLNFYILVAIIFQVIGELLDFYYLKILRPLPMILMILYVHGKNSPRDHLVPNLIEIGLIISLVGDLLLMSGETSTFLLGSGFFILAHIVYTVAFRMGDQIRFLRKRYRMLRKFVYAAIILIYSLKIYALWDKFPNHVFYVVCGIVAMAEGIVILSRYEITATSSFYFMLIGVGLYVVSDNFSIYLKLNEI